MIVDDMEVLAILGGVVALVSWASRIKSLSAIFNIIPPFVWLYALPMVLSEFGILPSSSPVYSWLAKYLLPASLLLIMLSVDIPALRRVGGTAVGMLLFGTVGIALGTIISFLLTKSILPPDGWQMMAMVSADFIGGSANFLAVQQSLQADPSIIGPLVIADTIVGYSWLAMLLLLSPYKEKIDKYILKADRTKLDEALKRFESKTKTSQDIGAYDILLISGGAIAIAITVRLLSEVLPVLGDPVIVSASTWTMLIAVSLGVGLSITPAKQLEEIRASQFGYAFLYFIVPAVGAQANVSAIIEAPQVLLAVTIVMVVHIVVLFIGGRLLRAPSFFLATGSMANVGGVVSASVAAAAYEKSLLPLGALLGVAGYLLGTYIPIGLSVLLANMASG